MAGRHVLNANRYSRQTTIPPGTCHGFPPLKVEARREHDNGWGPCAQRHPALEASCHTQQLNATTRTNHDFPPVGVETMVASRWLGAVR
eukprot:450755-Pelagomonas_calceolata.AAC.12